MKIFSTKNRGWAVTIGFISLIYISTGIVGSLTIWLREHGLQTLISNFIMFFFAILYIYTVFFILRRRTKVDIFVGLLLLGCYFLTTLVFAQGLSDKIHVAEYGLLTIMIFYTLKFDLKTPYCYILAWVLTCIVGLSDELFQHQFPTRVSDPEDILTNILTSIISLLLIFTIFERKD
ncbi:MAG: VanZ family protein [Nitrospinota bacterium]